MLCEALRIVEPCPEEFIGSFAAVPLPDAPLDVSPRLPFNEYPLQGVLGMKHWIEVPVIFWPAAPRRLPRISAQLNNPLPQYDLLARALTYELPEI
jgi:isopenicillin-N epimerase